MEINWINDTQHPQQQQAPSTHTITYIGENKENPIETVTCRKNLFNSSPKKNGDKDDHVEITKSEYEEIKQRVSAIETRLTQEFSKIEALANNSFDFDSPNKSSHLNGPEKVLSRYEKTLEETDFMNSSPSMELAQELSRGLNIRRKPEQKIFRSPSARKISKIRRSLENAPLQRNKSWHFSSRNHVVPVNNSPLKELRSYGTPIRTTSVEKDKALDNITIRKKSINPSPKSFNSTTCLLPLENHKLTENVFVNKQPINSSSKIFNSPNPVLQTDKNNVADNVTVNRKLVSSASKVMNSPSKSQTIQAQEPHIQNDEWICADTFFKYNVDNPKDNVDALILQSSSKKSRNSVKLDPDSVNASPMVASSKRTPKKTDIHTNKNLLTPMLPPRVPTNRKTPNACNSTSKTPHSVLSVHKSKLQTTPLWQQEQEQIAGRASIARLRRQNAGMVMAKAKLFNELVVDQGPSHKVALPAAKKEMHNLLNIQKHKSPKANLRISHDHSGGMQYRRNSRHSRTPEARRTPIDTTPQIKQNLMNKQPRRIVRVHNR